MHQSAKSRDWQSSPLMTAGHRSEARMTARLAEPERFEPMMQETRPSADWLPRPGS
ncbi:hypothetical protein [Paenibacillus barengoltzii]|jgi:hypothetical protein|uniref:Uncharacterized protein n=1 Tax=Paenibacillus barengoltzii J12 TaxID=935846 RepID=A0ABY1LS22_9BACL|nr:hypothetical protein [Paenibacillus barengoltzii]MEC2345907.1 hypothetical protein [Paenibacillus barengoltzii]SME92529.1 hypothetical protein SAMN02744124_00243 [Paenibacillus barengoltzii J12]SMF35167.1 hypothetical protein SAMN02744102_02799 [Paenibacillus barengoltzii]